MSSDTLDDKNSGADDRAHLATEHSKLLSVIGSDLSESSDAISQANELAELATEP
jgi:hypothetical protein